MGRIRLKTGGVTFGSLVNEYLNCGSAQRVHRIVAVAFVPNLDAVNKTYVNHIDGCRTNNRADNLEWVTPSGNVRHAVDTGLKLASKNGRPVQQFDKDDNLIALHPSIAEASRVTGCNAGNIGSACRGKVYRTVGGFVWRYAELAPPALHPVGAPIPNPNSRMTEPTDEPQVDTMPVKDPSISENTIVLRPNSSLKSTAPLTADDLWVDMCELGICDP
jgi:hypothetical protein